jgi:hypothetical protein
MQTLYRCFAFQAVNVSKNFRNGFKQTGWDQLPYLNAFIQRLRQGFIFND